jgi:hypoxanthine phosphoribosyltransferase
MKSDETLKVSSYDGKSYVCPSWERMREYNFSLAQQIIDSGRHFDRIVALAKGGLTWSRAMVDYLKLENLSSTCLKSYGGVNNQVGRVRVVQPLADKIDGENILIFDDVADSGETIKKAKEYVEVLGGQNVAVATLCYKPRSCFIPDFYAFSTDAWVVFPHESREFIEEVGSGWLQKGLPIEEIKTRFINIGLPKEEITYFLPQLPQVR